MQESMNKQPSSLFCLLTPCIVIIITQATALTFREFTGTYVYIPIILIYWATLLLLIARYGIPNIRIWLRRPQGHILWPAISLLVGFSSLPMFIQHFPLLSDLRILVPHILFFLINPWIEEFYWRGILIDVTRRWPPLLSILYSSILFTIWHSAFSWEAESTRTLSFYLPVLAGGIVMALVYLKTRSLWFCILSHMLVNLFNMSVPVLLNLVVI